MESTWIGPATGSSATGSTRRSSWLGRISSIRGSRLRSTPPVLLYLTVPFTFLPAVLWWATPLAIMAIALWRIQPQLETWPLLALLLLYPRTWVMLVYGNPSMWAFAALAAGLAWTWPAPLVAIKVTLGPFALVGVRRRSWWITAGVALALSVPFAAMWPDYITAISNARNGYGLEYLVGEWPIAVALVVVAWVRAERLPGRGPLQASAIPPEGQTRPETQ